MSDDEMKDFSRGSWLQHAYTQKALRGFQRGFADRQKSLLRAAKGSSDPDVVRAWAEYAAYEATVALLQEGVPND